MALPYRDEITRLTLELEARREAHRSTSARIDIAQNERAEMEGDIAGLEKKLEQARRRLRVLDDVEVATPCHASWNAMAGDDRVRFCGSCQKNVYNLSSMSTAEAEEFVEKTEGEACIRFYRRADGTMLTSDCPEGAKARRFRRRVSAAVGGIAIAGTGLVSLAGMSMQGQMELPDRARKTPTIQHHAFDQPVTPSDPHLQPVTRPPVPSPPPVSSAPKKPQPPPPPHATMGFMDLSRFQ